MVLKYLEKIGEITSIGVAKQHIELLAAQLEAKEKECERFRLDVEPLKSENDRLRGENSRLKRAVEDAKPDLVTAPELSDEQIKIILHLFDRGRDGLPLEQMASFLGIKESMAQYHIEALEKTGLIDIIHVVMGEGVYYGLSESGRAYIVKHKLCS